MLGGRAEVALRRAGTIGDGIQTTGTGPDGYADMAAVVRAAARDAGRPEPIFQARCQVLFDQPARGFYALAGSAGQMLADVGAFRERGVSHIAVDLRETDPDHVVAAMERFDREIVAQVRADDGATATLADGADDGAAAG